MQRSPLLHPLAILRKTVDLTQKEMGDLVNRAARTIQSIELNKLPLTEELALRIAEATGVDEAWLFAGDPGVPPLKGVTLLAAGKGDGVYTKADYEFYRAYVETKLGDEKEWAETLKKAEAKGNKTEVAKLALEKLDAMARQKAMTDLMDQALVGELQLILVETKLNGNMRLARWKIRRFLDELAKELSIKIPKLNISTKTIELPVRPHPPKGKVAEPVNSKMPVTNPETKLPPA